MLRNRLSAATAVCALTVLTALAAPASARSARARKMPPAARAAVVLQQKAAADDKQRTQKLAALVRMAQPRKGDAYARKVASAIVHSARLQRIDPYLVAATGYCESEFSMASRPYIGIMQVSGSLARYYARLGYRYDIRTIEGNIGLGAHVLARHGRSSRLDRASLPSRGTLTSRSRLAYAVGRYNGSGAGSSYTSRVMRAYTTIKNGTPADWKKKIRSGKMLWR